MSSPDKLALRARLAAVALAICAAASLSGCGTPGAPLPPSLNLPEPVANLAAVRAGDKVTLTWTMPRRTTDKVILKAPLQVRICRREGSDACETAADLTLAPMALGTFTETLPAALGEGSARPLGYFVEIRNRRGRSAGLSNAAVVLAGEAPPPVADLAAEVRKDGIVLRWKAADPRDAIRLERTLENPPPADPHAGALAAPPEPVRQILNVPSDAGEAIDKAIVFSRTYEYRAQRVAHSQSDGRTLELAGDLSAPVRIAAEDVFPPAIPEGLAAVANAPVNGGAASIDLSWQPNTEPDLAGYYVYRREAETPWRRISGEQPVPGPAFHDPSVEAGHAYIYGVSAVDRKGHESTRSADAEETVPQQ
ncbi:MAG TPA: fibronectin type III domain-containing protein [Terracidiphilus sp.]|nr:fibronectin type III domain-containing protein [Terracidiphilus sp.]